MAALAPAREPCSDAHQGTKFGPDRDAMAAHLNFLFNRPDMIALNGLIELNTEDDAHRLNWWRRFRVSEIDKAVQYAMAMTGQRRRVYVGAGLRRGDMRQNERSFNGDILAWSALVWDFDNQETAEVGLTLAAQLGVPFNFVVQTGRLRNGGQPDLRLQCWTSQDAPITDMGRVGQLLKAGIRVFGSDKSIHDARRIVRLAGSVSWARKDGRVDEPTKILFEHMTFGA